MGLLCVVPTLLDFGLEPLLHVSHMNVVVCFDCKHAIQLFWCPRLIPFGCFYVGSQTLQHIGLLLSQCMYVGSAPASPG